MELTLDKLLTTGKYTGIQPVISVKLPDGTKLELNLLKIGKSTKNIDAKINEYRGQINSAQSEIQELTARIQEEQQNPNADASIIQNLSNQINDLGNQIASDTKLLDKFRRIKTKLKRLYTIYMTEAAKKVLQATGVGTPIAFLLDWIPVSIRMWFIDHVYFLLLLTCLPCFCILLFIFQLQQTAGDPFKIAEVFNSTGCDPTQLAGIGYEVQTSGNLNLENVRNLDCNFKQYTDKNICDRTGGKSESCK